MIRSRLRFGAGVCVLATGLLMGGGAVAVADPVSGGSPNGDDGGTNLPVRGGTASSPVGKITGTLPKTLQDVASTVGSGPPPGQQSSSVTSTVGSDQQPGQQPSTGAKSPKKEPGGTGSGLVAAVPDPVAAVPNAVAAVPDPVAAVPNAVASVPNLVAPVTDVLTPVSDVIAPGQYMPTSVAGAVVPLTQPPSDLSSFLLGVAGVAPVEDGSGGVHGPGLAAAAGGSGASPVPLVLPLVGISGVPVAGNATRFATLDVTLLGRVSALSGMAPQAPNGAFPMGAEPYFPNVFDELLLIASLWALAAVALPGIGGLVILTLAGVRMGYGRLTPESPREHRALRASVVRRAVKRWMSAR